MINYPTVSYPGVDRHYTNIQYYTGIGSRETPENILERFKEVASILESKRFILRSGGANGADSAFESGVVTLKEIYLPWRSFNSNISNLYLPKDRPTSISLENKAIAESIVEKVHPAWNRLSYAARLLHTRNVFQVLGKDLLSSSKFLICWTKDGKIIGGTATAIKIATDVGIPVINLGSPEGETQLEQLINNL